MAQRCLSRVAVLLLLVVGAAARADTPARAPSVPITFEVTVPPATPADAEVWLSGNLPALGAWNGAGVKLTRTPDGRFTTEVALPSGAALEFKVTRGAWATVERGASGEELANRTLRVGRRAERVSLTVSRWADASGTPSALTGDIRYLRGVTSRHLQRSRDVIVWLPPGYDTRPRARYPVLYMHDGQNLMDAATAYSGEWHVDETAQLLVRAGKVEPLIIVGVYNTDRFDEYTPVRDPGEFADLGGGNAQAYGRFLVEELKPLVDGTFRTRPGARDTGLVGSSLGGLVTMYLGVTHADTFGRLGVLSPSVFWGNRDIVSRVRGLPKKLPLRIWLDIGTEEWRASQETVEDTRLLRDALVARGWVLGKDLRYVEVPRAIHTESAWAERFDDLLLYLFPAPRR
jgi:predicted alpha/beta superfamily hydrolase